MKQISFFHKGLNLDLDYSKLTNNGFVLPTANIDILNKEGQGLIVTVTKGNKEVFPLSPGFQLIGAKDFNGIAYIVSYNPTTNEGEVGSYPSPAQGGGFEPTYKPLMNIRLLDLNNTSGIEVIRPMRSTIFNFDLEHPIGDQIVISRDYDGTVNIIWTDFKNSIRIVNSGFDQDGIYKPKRFYVYNTLNESIQLIKHPPLEQQIQFVSLSEGGRMKGGNLFFFYRYVDHSHNRTEFVAESQPIAITMATPIPQGSENELILNNGDNTILHGFIDSESTKKVLLSVNNLDKSYAFIEFAFIRFHSSAGTVAVPEVMLVDMLFAIPRDLDGLSIEITGFETQIPIDISEILRPVNRETICKSILSHERRMWGANWKATSIDIDLLAEAALLIKIGCDDSKTIPRENFQDFYSQPGNLKYAGYFRGEAYLCRVAFKLKDGFETEAFPVMGIDARMTAPADIQNAYANNSLLVNERGIIILPQLNISPIVRFHPLDHRMQVAHIMGITYNISGLISWMNDKQWFKDNVSEIIFLRAERKPNLAYQGVSTRVFGRKINQLFSPMKYNGASIPIMIGRDQKTQRHNAGIPTVDRDTLGNNTSEIPGRVYFNTQYSKDGNEDLLIKENQSSEEEKIRAVFSSDYIFGDKERITDGERPWVVPTFIVNERHELHEGGDRSPFLPRIRMRNFDRLIGPQSPNLSIGVRAKAFSNVHNYTNWIYPDNRTTLGLVNRTRDCARNGGVLSYDDFSQSLFYSLHTDNYVQYCNRSIQVPPYFGFELDGSDANHPMLSNDCALVNIYKFDPNSNIYFNLYNDELNVPYFKINEKSIRIKNILEGSDIIVCYQGDAFLQSTIIKSRTWFPTEQTGVTFELANNLTVSEVEPQPIGASITHFGYAKAGVSIAQEDMLRFMYAHGELLEIVSENTINTALRVKTINENTFFPLIPSLSAPIVDGSLLRGNLSNKDWALYPFTKEPLAWGRKLTTGIESYLINNGNSITLSLKGYLPSNPNFPKGLNIFPNRIRYTGKQDANFPTLSYRIWMHNHKEDFDEMYGEMTRIQIVFGRLLSIQESSIFAHFTHREETIPTSSGEMVIGVRSILSAEPMTIARFGSQHIFSITYSKSGTVGWDWNNNVIWRIIIDETGSLIARSLDKEQMIENYLKGLKALKDGDSNDASTILRNLKDRMFLPYGEQEGILTSSDKTTSEVLFTVVFNGMTETIRYNEDLNSFIGTYSFPAKFYFSINNAFYSVPVFKGAQEAVFIHGGGEPACFYGIYYNPVISFIVNGYISETQPLVNVDKLYKAMEIESPKTPAPFERVLFKTLFQEGENNPFHNQEQFWLTPEYLMSKWAFPINVASIGQEQFYVESNMQGKWMKVTIIIKKGIDTFIKNVITKFITSQA